MKCLFEADTICRLCLRVDEKVNRLNNIQQKAFIETNIILKQSDYVLTDDLYVCDICKALLTKSFNFMQTIWSAQKIIYAILKNTNMITKQMLYGIDRHRNRLNPVTFSSVVAYCDNMKCQSSNDTFCDSNTNIDIKELNLDLLIQNEELGKQMEPHKQNPNMNFTHATNENKPTIICISDEDEESNRCYLDGVKVEICNNIQIDDIIQAESLDPIMQEYDTDVCDETIPETIEKTNTIIKTKNGLKNPLVSTASKDLTPKTNKKKNIKKDIDVDYQPDSTSDSEDSDYYCDAKGKLVKRPKDDRVYPMQCVHCDFEVLDKRSHYHHYLRNHPNIEYPYNKLVKDYACMICGKLIDRKKIRSHVANHHTIQKISCHLCPKVFSNKLKIQRHMTRVHPKKTFTCDYCSKIFKTKVDIIRHIWTHTGSKPFKCHICGVGFAHNGNRNAHIRVKHQNEYNVAKKQKRTQKVRRNKKHESTDTDISFDSEETIRKIKRRNKMTPKRNSMIPGSKSNNKKVPKSVNPKVVIGSTDTAMISEDGKKKLQKKQKTEIVNDINIEQRSKHYKNAEIESDDEILTGIKRKNTRKRSRTFELQKAKEKNVE